MTIYEDGDLLVIDKPAGVVIDDVYPDLDKIHRLDKETSGVLLIAKNQESLFFYQKQFRDKSKGLEKSLEKRYIALVIGKIEENEGKIETLIGRGKNDRKKQKVYLSHEPNITGARQAVTRYAVMKRFNEYTLLEVYPETGRKHQIRVHLAYLNHPIVGDKVYGFKGQNNLGLNRHFLHANYIKVELLNRKRIEFNSDLPRELQLCLKKLK